MNPFIEVISLRKPPSPRQSCPFIYAIFVLVYGRKKASSTLAAEQKKIRNPMAVFIYASKTPESRRQYPHRFRIFLNYLRLEVSLEEQTEQFYLKASRRYIMASSSL
jgi:hypothetical protein